ncbi:hypothetical protein ABPG77_001471 [Micractinium sp. CCAP 211/92]
MESSVPRWLRLALSAAGGAITAGTAYYMAVAERFAAIEQGEQALERSIVSLDAKVEAGQAELRRLLQPLAHELANETLENETARLKGEQQQLGVMLQQPMASALMHGGTSTPRLQGGTGESSNPSRPAVG